MSETVIVFAALFAIGMIGLGLVLFVKGAKEETDDRNRLPDWARPRGLG